MAASTQTVELEALQSPWAAQPKTTSLQPPQQAHRRDSGPDTHDSGNSDDGLPPPTTATLALEKWNDPKANIFRISAVFWSFLVCGANDAAYGALIPYLETYYHLSYIVVSLIFLSPFVGYMISASTNNWLHLKIGQRWIGFLCGACHAAAYLIISQAPPYPVLVLAYAIAGFGNGIGDAAWNAWVGNLAMSNELLGFMHAVYGAGGTASPLIATTMITEGGLGWNFFYYVMLGMAVVECVTLTWSFWPKTAQDYRETTNADNETNTGTRTALFKMPFARVTWLCAFFLLGYVGVEVSLGGWVVQFMLRVRDANPFDAGMTSVGFWLGITLGRAFLGLLTPKLGVKLSLIIFIPVTMGLELVFWLVPEFHVSAVAVALQGFFLGPMFPCVVVAATKLLPRHLHVSTIGFAAAFGGSGAAVLPFAVGAIAQAKGVQVLQPIILAILGVLLIIWVCLPRFGKKRD